MSKKPTHTEHAILFGMWLSENCTPTIPDVWLYEGEEYSTEKVYKLFYKFILESTISDN